MKSNYTHRTAKHVYSVWKKIELVELSSEITDLLAWNLKTISLQEP
jgi:(p)ppGpp synthase/HD superfamily hydrolase